MKMSFPFLAALLFAVPISSAGAQEDLVAFHAKEIHLYGGGVLKNGWLLVQEGKVVGGVEHEEALPPFVEVVDFGENIMIPGLVAADAPLTGSVNQGDHALGAHRRAWDDYSPFQDFNKALERGITTVYLSPDRNRLVGGRGAVVKTAGSHRVLRKTSDLRVSLEGSAFSPPSFFRPPVPPTSENPIRPATPQAADSLAGAAMALRESAQAALAGATDPHSLAFAEAIQSKASLRIVVDSVAGIRVATDLAKEWGMPLILETSKDLDARIPLPAEVTSLIVQAPLRMGFGQPSFREDDSMPYLGDVVVPGSAARWTWLWEASLASLNLRNEKNAAAASLNRITSRAARVLGVQDSVGTLLPGQDADFVVMDGALLDSANSVRRVFIDGQSVWERPDRMQGSTVLRAGTLWTGLGAPITGGAEVLIQDGKIVAAGKIVPHPAGAEVMDAGPDAHITPGFVDAGNHYSVGSNADPSALLGLLGVNARFHTAWRNMAAGGVTTAVLGPSRASDTGARYFAVKTGAVLPEDAWVQGHDVVRFDFGRTNRADLVGKIQSALKRGKKYAEKWSKWWEERAKWEKENAEKTLESRREKEKDLRMRLAQGAAPEKKVEEKKEEVEKEEEKKEEKAADPLNGVWEGLIEHEMIPEPLPLTARIHHDGGTVIGLFSTPMAPGEEEELEGEWDESSKTILFSIPTEMGNVEIRGEIDGPDHMAVHIELEGIGAVDFEMNRTEIEEAGAAPVRKKRKKKEDGPSAPEIDPKLEGMRALLEGRGVAVVRVSRVDEARAVLQNFSAEKIPIQLEGLSPTDEVIELLKEYQAGVVVDPDLIQRKENVDYVPAAIFHQHGVSTAIQSKSWGAQAGSLSEVLTMAVRHGLGAEVALQSVTYGAATLLGLSHQVGSLASGMDADVVVHSGAPFALSTRILQVFANGEEVVAP